MISSNKTLFLSVVMITIISVAANFYSFNKLNDINSKTTSDNTLLLEKKDIEIDKLQGELLSLSKENVSSPVVVDSKIMENKNEKNTDSSEGNTDNKINELLNSATHFIEYTYNVTPDNYALLKQNSSEYMTNKLAESLFASNGINEDVANIKTTVNDIKVFIQSEGENEAVVYYEYDLEFINNGYKESNSAYVNLKFIEQGNKIKVSEIEAINRIGGV